MAKLVIGILVTTKGIVALVRRFQFAD